LQKVSDSGKIEIMGRGSRRLDRLLEGLSGPEERPFRSGGLLGLTLIAGVIIGFIVVYGYELAGESRFCGACHSMEARFMEWSASHHKQFACVECHMPASNVLSRVSYKAVAGVRDLVHETKRDYGVNGRLSAESVAIANANCLRCHRSTIEGTSLVRGSQSCLKCHTGLVHGRNRQKGGITIEGEN
jgi:cytochrome c nitrite reductase small subunit